MLYNLVGFMAGFHIIQTEWRNSIHKMLADLVDSETLMSFNLPKKNFDFTENEIVKNGHFYDVVKYETVGDSIKIYCIDDEYETRLVSEFHGQLFENTAQKTDFQGKTQGFFKLMIKEFLFDKDFSLKCPPSVCQVFSAVFYYKKALFLSPFLDFDSPPPQGLLIQLIMKIRG
jgi:hypothetical protein